MPLELSVASPPAEGIYRLARAVPGPFEPPSWEFAGDDGTFGNRFDDPAVKLPEQERYRAVYCATQRQVAFAETLARMRSGLAWLPRIDQRSNVESVDQMVAPIADPIDPSRALVSTRWQQQRVMGHTVLQPHLQFADLSTVRTSQHLRFALAREALAHGARDIDQSLLMESNRSFTRLVARYIYELRSEDGSPRFAGIRYISRFDSSWECWAVFHDRMKHVMGMPSAPESIQPNDPDLLEIASIFSLTIETVEGSGHYYRP